MEFTQITEANVTSQTNHHLNQQGEDVMHEVVVTECEKYPSKIILKDATILDKVIKLHGVHFLRTITNKKHPVLNCTCTQ